MLHAHSTVLCVIDAELLAMEFLHYEYPDLCWHAGFRCDLDLDPMTFIYKLDPY